ncbi:hypothetical protein [Vitiosangium sp. GDMCC 1.1324]|uniref:hypothetical protein n=1 Tax=Vitiosangium sp. (strain GDMCC 1.1324) TaxID=2138576 RepID=UPI000D3BD55F|nr:hypothetical protein [Vitiosangium sp. GDMCC 1.1324]PTL84807.1 hypothetical protein DAT35_07040 [Vitiosangium sp. GDMCC 1.1324]
MNGIAPTALRPSFYEPVAGSPREDLLRAYREFLERRNGTMDFTTGFSRREEWLREAAGWEGRFTGPVDGEGFNRAYESFDAVRGLTPPMVALLTFVKANAGEAYGVEVLTRERHQRHDAPELFHQVERLVAYEETYHTRILIGATQHFGVEVEGAWRPPLPLRLLIGTLVHAPGLFFHPVLLAAEVSGVFSFNWMLRRVGEIFRDEPAVRESMEQRLIEILVDEVGHVAFNRMAVGPVGLSTARHLAGVVLRGVMGSTPEYRALGMDENELRKLDTFDLHQLPEEVLRRSYFV